MTLSQAARPALLASAGLALVLAVGLLLPGGLEFSVRPRKGGRPLLLLPLRAGERWTMHYVHSVNGLPIWEVHSVDQRGRIFIEEERFVAFGAGMGHWPGHGRHVLRKIDGRTYQVLSGIHRSIGEFVLRVGSRKVGHTIIWRKRRFNLSAHAAGKALLISARPVSLLQGFWRRLFPHVVIEAGGNHGR